jgi:hypothetical protein
MRGLDDDPILKPQVAQKTRDLILLVDVVLLWLLACRFAQSAAAETDQGLAVPKATKRR